MFIMYIDFLDYHNCVKGHITSDRKENMTFELWIRCCPMKQLWGMFFFLLLFRDKKGKYGTLWGEKKCKNFTFFWQCM